MTAPDAAGTDLLNIDPSNPADPSMQPGSVVTDDCTTLSGTPNAWSSGPVVAYRLPILLGGFISLGLCVSFYDMEGSGYYELQLTRDAVNLVRYENAGTAAQILWSIRP